MTLTDLFCVLAGYLIGSLPIGLLVGWSRGVDVRKVGSGNIGATNVGRVLGKPWFYVVFTIDFAKSFVPVLLAARFASAGGLEPQRLRIAVGVAAVVGHVFSLFLRFKGGKGVATATGVFAALAPAPTAIAFLSWLVVYRASRFVSLASLTAAVALPLACWLVPLLPGIAGARGGDWSSIERPVQWAATIVGALIVLRHRSNIGRLLRGEESRTGKPAT